MILFSKRSLFEQFHQFRNDFIYIICVDYVLAAGKFLQTYTLEVCYVSSTLILNSLEIF